MTYLLGGLKAHGAARLWTLIMQVCRVSEEAARSFGLFDPNLVCQVIVSGRVEVEKRIGGGEFGHGG